MKNSEIVAIVDSYIASKKREAKEREEGLYVTQLSLPAFVAWKRRVNFKKLFEAYDLIMEALKEADLKYSDDEHSSTEGEIKKVKPEFLSQYFKDRMDILEQETEIPIAKVKVSEIGDVDLTDDDLDTLMFMIEE